MRVIAAAVWGAIVAGAALVVASLVDVPRALVAGAALLLLASVALAFLTAVVASRREGAGFGRALADDIRTAFGWIVAFLP